MAVLLLSLNKLLPILTTSFQICHSKLFSLDLFSSESVVIEDKQPRSVTAHLCRHFSSVFSLPAYCTCACWKIRDNRYILSVKRFSGNWVNNILSLSADRLYNKHKELIWITDCNSGHTSCTFIAWFIFYTVLHG
jgi:hypothetical protein